MKSQELNRLGLIAAGARVLKALLDHQLKSVQSAGVGFGDLNKMASQMKCSWDTAAWGIGTDTKT